MATLKFPSPGYGVTKKEWNIMCRDFPRAMAYFGSPDKAIENGYSMIDADYRQKGLDPPERDQSIADQIPSYWAILESDLNTSS